MNYLNVIALVSAGVSLLSGIYMSYITNKEKKAIKKDLENKIITIITTKNGKKLEYTLLPDTVLETLLTDETEKIEILNKTKKKSSDKPEEPLPMNA